MNRFSGPDDPRRSPARYSRRRFLRLGACVAGLSAVALAGCTPTDDDPATGTVPAPPHEGDVRVRFASTRTERSTERTALRLGVLAGEVAPDGLDPISSVLTYSRLVGLDPRTASVYGDLAEEIELPDPLVVRLRLRENRHFHPDPSGVALGVTAEAVKRDFEARRAEGTFLFTEVIEAIEAPTSRDVVLRLKAPFSLLFEFLARPDASIRGRSDYGAFTAPVGSGPFLPSALDGMDLLMRPNPLATGEQAPLLAQVRIRRAEQQSDLDAMFARGELDVREHPDARSREVAQGREDRIELARPRYRMRGLALSLLAPRDQASLRAVEGFRDDRVRRALSVALNRGVLVEDGATVLSGPVGPAFAGDALPQVELEAHPLYQHSVEDAVALLDAAGFGGLELRLAHSDSPLMLDLAQQIADQLSEAGFRVRLAGRPDAEFQTAFLGGDFEAAFFELDRLTSPDIGLRLHMTGGLEGNRSPWGYSNPVYDAQVREALSEIDPAERTRRSREAQRLLLEDVPAMLPLTAPLEYASVAPEVSGYAYDAYGFNAGILARYWQGGPEGV